MTPKIKQTNCNIILVVCIGSGRKVKKEEGSKRQTQREREREREIGDKDFGNKMHIDIPMKLRRKASSWRRRSISGSPSIWLKTAAPTHKYTTTTTNRTTIRLQPGPFDVMVKGHVKCQRSRQKTDPNQRCYISDLSFILEMKSI